MQSRIILTPPTRYGLGWRIYGNVIAAFPQLMIIGYLVLGLIMLDKESPLPGLLFLLATGTALLLSTFVVLPFFGGYLLLARDYGPGDRGVFCQISLTPRRYAGLEGVLDDADDFGHFYIDGEYLAFRGNSTDVLLHRSAIQSVNFRNIGWRAYWMAGNSADVYLVQPMSGVWSFNLAAREGATIIGTRKAADRFTAQVEEFLRTYNPTQPPPVPFA